MEQDMLAGKLAEVDAQLAGVHAKLQSAAQMESTELVPAIAQTREEMAQCAHALAERLRHSRAIRSARSPMRLRRSAKLSAACRPRSGAAMRAEREMQLLFAEYAMDFAMQAARHALLGARGHPR